MTPLDQQLAAFTSPCASRSSGSMPELMQEAELRVNAIGLTSLKQYQEAFDLVSKNIEDVEAKINSLKGRIQNLKDCNERLQSTVEKLISKEKQLSDELQQKRAEAAALKNLFSQAKSSPKEPDDLLRAMAPIKVFVVPQPKDKK